jgi:hypothetical protein
MILTAIAAGLLFQVTPTPRDTIRIGEPAPVIPSLEEEAPVLPPPVAGDTIFDSPGTRELVERVIRTGGTVPDELRDYRAEMRAAIHLSMRADTTEAGEIPATVDELAGTMRWERGGAVEQTIHGHRVRLLAPVPYTVGSMLEAPWIIPHLYGNTINVFQLAAPSETAARVSRAIHPFSLRGIDFYRYATGDTVRVRTQEGTTTLVPVNVVPRPGRWPEGTDRLVAGAFWVDLDRAAVVRARFGFTERTGRLVVLETGIFFELESALVGGRFWLPYRQRREIQVSSPLLGGATALRMVTALSRFELNTGWVPERRVSRLVWALTPREDVFQDWERVVGEEAGALDIADFADLRELVRRPDVGGPIRAAIHYERSEHFFRHNRVEGPYVGLGVRVEPRDPAEREWSVYGTGGYAFAEGTARGEVNLRWHPSVTTPASTARWAGVVGGYRRLREMTGFQPLVRWELGHTLSSAFAGYDVRDYYDVAGVDAFAIRRSGPWTSRLGVRYERQDSVTRNTTRYALGRANDFPEVVAAEPGTHTGVEGAVRYSRGAGALGVRRGLVFSAHGEAGLGDFRIQRGSAVLSMRQPGRYVSFLGRGDVGGVAGAAPPQYLFRFGGPEGLRGYERNAFGGSTAVLGRARALLHLPPYGSQPVFRSGYFLIPPLRPALVASGDAGWTGVSDASRPALERIGAEVTDGVRSSYGVGLSIFDDVISVERVWPGDGGPGRWYVGLVAWF